MSNYKVKVNNEVESREVQGLFFELGYKWVQGGSKVQHVKQSLSSNFGYLVAWSSGCFTNVIQCGCGIEDAKELTIPQLKDLVVLKRNSIDDATHTDQDDWKWYIGADSYVWGAGNASQLQQWDKSSLDHVELKPIIKPLKEYLRINNDGKYVLETTSEREAQEPHAKHWIEVPEGCDYLVSVFGANSFIEKSMIDKIKSNKSFKNVLWQRDKDEVMKEYIVPQDNGKYVLTKATEKRVSDWVEVPEGADIFTICGTFMAFWKDGAVKFIGADKDWDFKYDLTVSDYLDVCGEKASIVWQRHTQPEELPFVDDEPKPSKYDSSVWVSSKEQDLIFSPASISSLNDTYAEIEQVRQDNVNNPSHYSDSSIECIDAMEAMMTPEQFIGYLRGNVFKYQWRYEKKNGIEDLKKAQWYLDKLVAKVNEK